MTSFTFILALFNMPLLFFQETSIHIKINKAAAIIIDLQLKVFFKINTLHY